FVAIHIGGEIDLRFVTVGGSEEAFVAAKPLVFSMGKGAICCGGVGNGSSLGVASSTLSKIFNCSSARCWSSDSYNPVPGVMEGVPSSRDYNGGFASKLMIPLIGAEFWDLEIGVHGNGNPLGSLICILQLLG
ncbi:hypothetical protein S83_058128, partial [Arachis hypogaea]